MDKRAKIVEILTKVSGKPVNVEPEESLFDAGVLTSFELMDMLPELEKAFKIRIPDSAGPRKFESIERIEQYLESQGVD